METRAPYALIGAFVLAVVAAVFGFVYWLHNTGGIGDRVEYRVRFENSVSGLLRGAAVLFNGLRVGEVTNIALVPDNPRQILATIAVAPSTPIRSDTQVGMEYQGLTGVAVVSLTGGDPNAPVPIASGNGPPELVADPAAGRSVTESAREVLRKIDTILADNSKPLNETMTNLSTFTGALSKNADKVDRILEGLGGMFGGNKETPTVYDIAVPANFPPAPGERRGELAVAEPTALLAYDSQRIMLRPNPTETASIPNAQWTDNVPKLLQVKLIQALENGGRLAAVTRPDSLGGGTQLQVDVRSFQILTTPEPTAEIELGVKLVEDGGKVAAQKIFRATAPAKSVNGRDAVAAMNEAFAKIAAELVTWTAESVPEPLQP